MTTLAEFFWKRVDRRGPDECWPWLGTITVYGYGECRIGAKSVSKTWRAHRLSAYLHFGELGSHLVCHHCDNRACVNPAHLYLGSHSDNMRDMAQRGRHSSGNKQKTHCSKGHLLDRHYSNNTRRCSFCAKIAWHRDKHRRVLGFEAT